MSDVRTDPFLHPPLVPSGWRMLRGLLQVVVGLALVAGPLTLLSPPTTRSTFGIYGAPLVGIAIGWYVRQRISKVAGTLLIAGLVIHLVLWTATLVYLTWLARDLSGLAD